MTADEPPPDESASLIPPGVNVRRPCPARVLDALLGGACHFPADRRAADEILRARPDAAVAARAQRAFMWRAVRYLAARGITQYIATDGCLPTADGVHEAVRETVPGARVLYVEGDPVAVAHARLLLRRLDPAEQAVTGVVLADLRTPRRLLASPDLPRLLDLGAPVAVVLGDALAPVADEDGPAAIVAVLRRALAPGSAVVLSVPHPRSRERIAAWLDGLRVVEPGVVPVGEWRPMPDAEGPGGSEYLGYGAVAMVPGGSGR